MSWAKNVTKMRNISASKYIDLYSPYW